MGVKRDNVPFAGVHEGTESPKNRAKRRSHALRLVWTYLASSRKTHRRKKSKQRSKATLCGWSGLTEPKAEKPPAFRTVFPRLPLSPVSITDMMFSHMYKFPCDFLCIWLICFFPCNNLPFSRHLIYESIQKEGS